MASTSTQSQFEALYVGDIVGPVTDGPEMIVTRLPWGNFPSIPGEISTTWIDARQRQQHGSFPREALRILRRISEPAPTIA